MNDKKKETKTLTLSLGENSDSHVLQSNQTMKFKEHHDHDLLVKCFGGVVLHHTHDRIVLPPGVFYCSHQQEYNPFDNAIAPVFD